jgi:hypothetical protein
MVFSGYQPRQVFVLNRRFEDHLGHHHQGSDVSSLYLVRIKYYLTSDKKVSKYKTV